MGKDILTMFNRYHECRSGRKGYFAWKYEKVVSVSPSDYGEFLQIKKCKMLHKK